LKANPEAEHQEVPKEEDTVKYSGAQKKRHRHQHLAEKCRGQLKEQTWVNCGSWKKLAAASMKMTCHTGVVL
jgi:hypothetical protein